MPILVKCGTCKRKLRIPEALLGRKVKCPGCGTAFKATSEQEPEPAPQQEEESPAESSASQEQDEDAGWEEVDSKKSKERIRSSPSPTPKRARPQRSSSRPAGSDDADEDDVEAPPPRRRKRYEEDESDDDEEHRSSRRRRRYEEDENEDDEEYRSSRPRGIDWSRPRLGITLNLAAAGVDAANVLLYTIGLIISLNLYGSGGGAQTMGTIVLVMNVILFYFLIFVSMVLNILGHVFALWSPKKRAVQVLAIVVLAVVGTATLLYWIYVGMTFLQLGLASRPVYGLGVGFFGVIIYVVSRILFLAGLILFMFFIRGIALIRRDERLAGRAVNYVIGVGAYVAAWIVGICSLFTLLHFLGRLARSGTFAPQPPTAEDGIVLLVIMGIIGLLYLVGFLGLFGWYVTILFQVRSLLARK